MKVFLEYQVFADEEGFKKNECLGKFPTKEDAIKSGKGKLVLAYATRILHFEDKEPKDWHFFGYGRTFKEAVSKLIYTMVQFQKKNPSFPTLQQLDQVDKDYDKKWADSILSKI